MKIGFCGLGFVGTALINFLLNKGYSLNDNLYVYDKYKQSGSVENILLSDILFVSLPTPFSVELNSYNIDEFTNLFNEINGKYKGVILIKSTLEPTICEQYANKYDLTIIHNPEFLSMRTADKDVESQNHIILGKTTKCTQEKIDVAINFYKLYFPTAHITVCNSNEAELIKIALNNFYAIKVQYFTELYLLCQKLDVNYDIIKNAMLNNGWINKMHTDVPGHDGKYSYGGACFTKDAHALSAFMQKMNTPCDVIVASLNERNKMRNDMINVIL